MSAFPQPLRDVAAPLMRDNIDTDTIIPSREIRSTGRDGLADGLFAPWRYLDMASRIEDPKFVLNQPDYRSTSILAAGANLGCGSSREHAVWALAEWGIKAIIAESFAPIFEGNCIRNFILPVALDRAAVEALAGSEVTIDLAAQEVSGAAGTYSFAIDPEAKQMLAEGLDAIDLTLTQASDIDGWTAQDRTARPWVYLGGAPA
ncbi:3-isopropylmalate dehydratase small subunit [uncultured Erythrobacter sp.]|uniref:3-isopropylmalate dehydratase small subunit n=1 Tax=uncultured Erythrobacter sp. TaxID=263913 RepID=UPI002605BEA0|nr:3-isopropylmalate dehydratase small subunit [uncultured Erythrobacter sp.]